MDQEKKKIEAIATKVLGCTKGVNGTGILWWDNVLECWVHRYFPPAIFDPRKNWRDCGMVIDRMAELGWELSMWRIHSLDKRLVNFSQYREGYITIQAMAVEVIDGDIKTAIMDAALEAVALRDGRL